MGCFLNASGRKFRSCFIYHRSSSACAYNHRYVCSGEIFLSFYVSDGSCFSILPIAATFTLHRDRAGCIKGCGACEKICPCDIGLPDDGSGRISGDCFQCQKCNGICPKSNIHTGIKQLRGNELWFTGIRAAILIAICIWLGV